MAEEDLRRRLSALNRERLPATQTQAATTAPGPGPPKLRRRARAVPRTPVSLDDVASGDVVETPRGSFLRILRPLQELWEECDEFAGAYAHLFDHNAFGVDPAELKPDMLSAIECGSDELLYMDIETTGLGGSPVFLIGLMHFDKRQFRIEQLLARDYSEEAGMIHHYHERCAGYRTLVTFNGKSFDVPQITDRSYATGVFPPAFDMTHLDVLHESRRRWKGQFANCKLQTLETCVCKRRRVGDIPGDQIPQAYHDFVRTGDAYQIKDILHHNALDLLTMAQLVVAMLEDKRV